MSYFEIFLQQSISFFAIIDPIGVSAILLSLLPQSTSQASIKSIAKKSSITIIVAFFVVLSTGDFLLKLFAISIDSVKIMGGLVLIRMALKMVEGKEEGENPKDNSHELAIIPLAIPITFGPGVFATIVVYKTTTHDIFSTFSLIISFLITAFFVYICFYNSLKIRKYLGIMGQKVITKLMGLIVGAIAIEFIISGVKNLWS